MKWLGMTWHGLLTTLLSAPPIEEQYLPSSTSFSIHLGCITSWSKRSDAILLSSSSLSASFVSSSSTGPLVWNCSRSKNGSTHLYVFERGIEMRRDEKRREASQRSTSTAQYSTAQHSTAQHSTARKITLQFITFHSITAQHCTTQHTAPQHDLQAHYALGIFET